MTTDLSMPQTRFPVAMSESGGVCTATIESGPRLSATGTDPASALADLTERLNDHIRQCLEARTPIEQPPDVPDGQPFVVPHARLQAALLFQWHMGSTSKTEVLRQLATSWIRVDEIARGRRSAGIDLLDDTAAALGYRLVLNYERASS